MILVSATGKVGSEAARLLAERGEEVRILAHHPENASELAASGVQVVLGDLDVPATIDAAMADATSIILTSSGAVPAHELNVIESALRVGGVDHVVKASSLSSPVSPVARQRTQATIEARLAESGLNSTVLKSNFYMQNMLMQAAPIAKASTFGSSAGSGKLGLVDSRDVAAIAAEIAAFPPSHRGKTYKVTGPELLSYYDIADILTALLGRTVTFSERTVEQDTQAMVAAGLPEPVAAMNALAVSQIAQGSNAWLSDDFATVVGRAPRSFAQFATEFLAAFS